MSTRGSVSALQARRPLFQKAVEAERIYDDPRLHEDPCFLTISVGEREQEEVYELAESFGEFMRAQKKLGNRTLPSVVRLFSRFMQGRVRVGNSPPAGKKTQYEYRYGRVHAVHSCRLGRVDGGPADDDELLTHCTAMRK